MMIDTGILYALADRRDKHHAAARAVFGRREVRVVTEAVVVETDWMILEYLGVEAELAFLGSLNTRAFVVEVATAKDRARALELARRHRDLELWYVDAVTMALAERLGETRIATIDRRHFGAVKPAHTEAFELVP